MRRGWPFNVRNLINGCAAEPGKLLEWEQYFLIAEMLVPGMRNLPKMLFNNRLCFADKSLVQAH